MNEIKSKIEALKTERGGWTKKALESLGVSWPPQKGWKKKLEESEAGLHAFSCKPLTMPSGK